MIPLSQKYCKNDICLSISGLSGLYNEMFSYTSPNDVITLTYRNVSVDCPEFVTSYYNTQTAWIVSLSTFNVVFDRSAVLDLYVFALGIVQRYVYIIEAQITIYRYQN